MSDVSTTHELIQSLTTICCQLIRDIADVPGMKAKVNISIGSYRLNFESESDCEGPFEDAPDVAPEAADGTGV